ncbi:MAG: PD40 domain-containing protein [Acidobacteria bacterium]|nr:PD40 domain-containing protein [Acidobacteriota bacterium]
MSSVSGYKSKGMVTVQGLVYAFGSSNVRPFRDGAFNQWFPAFSPDGRWLAYQSDELEKNEIYVAPFPGPGPTCKVSTSGGEEPRWSENGTELFYRQGNTAMAVNVSDRNFCHAKPRAKR